MKKIVKKLTSGTTTKGNCGECGHGATASNGCRCKSAWCPCHAKAFGHKYGAHSCKC